MQYVTLQYKRKGMSDQIFFLLRKKIVQNPYLIFFLLDYKQKTENNREFLENSQSEVQAGTKFKPVVTSPWEAHLSARSKSSGCTSPKPLPFRF